MHKWNITPEEAIKLQNELRSKIVLENRVDISRLEIIAASDLAYDGDIGYAVVLVYSYPRLSLLEKISVKKEVKFPYIPGLLAFREMPLLIDAASRLSKKPDVWLIDGAGLAHPRRMGIATHFGIYMDTPTVGCAKSHLFGKFKEPGLKQGDYSYIYDGDEIIGAVLRTKDNVNPLFISIGYAITLDVAIKLVLSCCDGYRLPKPLREAHNVIERIKHKEGEMTLF
ncbi:MAG: deoxyribonuclease V [Synergistetes bacterium]|nr:deoxyribonuclease V [Synergistota bacterium]MCX8127920.1 deoxyribonuclease V [Synergistota bacterium]MDW8192182.1 deoxyribonuclease V [Synergistota bacterium]